MKKIIILLSLLILFKPVTARLLPYADFLNLSSATARVSGMGNAYISSYGDVDSVFFNPAGLFSLKNFEISLKHLNWIEDVNMEAIGVAYSINKIKTTIGIGFSYLYMGDIIITKSVPDNSSAYLEGDFGTYTSSDMLLIFSIAHKFYLPLGLNFKFINQKIENKSLTDYAIDLGTYLMTKSKFSISFLIQNINISSIFSKEKKDNLPFAFKIGLGGRTFINNLRYRTDIGVGTTLNYNLGIEYNKFIKNKVIKSFSIRAGYRDEYKDSPGISGFTAGVGLNINIKRFNSTIDYAIDTLGELGFAHHISMRVSY